MVRLVLLLSPAAAASAGVGLVIAVEFALSQFYNLSQENNKDKEKQDEKKEESTEQTTESSDNTENDDNNSNKAKKRKLRKVIEPATAETLKKIVAKKAPKREATTGIALVDEIVDSWRKLSKQTKQIFAVVLLATLALNLYQYRSHCYQMAEHLSGTHLVMWGRTRDGKPILIDDFREAYWWLRDNTPEDSRVMAWWDYGYQINGIANRTSIADGNTWNHEHIALLGKCLVSTEKEAHKIAKHLADYVLVWTTRFGGMSGDDLAKMPHMANIAGSVYPEVQRTGYFMNGNEPTPLMKESLLYKLSTYRLMPGTPAPTLFKEVYTSKNNMVRIYQVLNVAPRTPFGKYAPQLKLGQFRQ